MYEQAMKLIEMLETPGNRLKTGLLLVPASHLTKANDIAVQLLADLEDIATTALEAVPNGSRYANLNASQIGQWLDDVSRKPTGHRRALVINLDLLLARLPAKDRAEVWDYLRYGMPYRPRVLIIVMPEEAKDVLPDVKQWENVQKCAWLGGNDSSRRRYG